VTLLRDSAHDPCGDYLPQCLLEGLLELVPGMGVEFSELDCGSRRSLSSQVTRGYGDLGDEDAFWATYDDLLPCHYLNRADGSTPADDVVTVSDFIPDRVFFRSRLYLDYFASAGEKYILYVPLPHPPGQTRSVSIARNDVDFSQRDRDLMALLQPHLAAAYRERRRSRILTAAQRRILECIAQGFSTDETAATLVVSKATVRKHLENAFERLGVSSRSAAVAAYSPASSRVS